MSFIFQSVPHELGGDLPTIRWRSTGFIRRNNATDSTNALRFSSFVPRSVRLYNRTPPELKRMDEEESREEFKQR